MSSEQATISFQYQNRLATTSNNETNPVQQPCNSHTPCSVSSSSPLPSAQRSLCRTMTATTLQPRPPPHSSTQNSSPATPATLPIPPITTATDPTAASPPTSTQLTSEQPTPRPPATPPCNSADNRPCHNRAVSEQAGASSKVVVDSSCRS